MKNLKTRVSLSAFEFGVFVGRSHGDIDDVPCPLCGNGMQYDNSMNSFVCRSAKDGDQWTCKAVLSAPKNTLLMAREFTIALDTTRNLKVKIDNMYRVVLRSMYISGLVVMPVQWQLTETGEQLKWK